MKTLALAIFLTASLTAAAAPYPNTPVDDSLCLHAATLAATIAMARERGITEDELHKLASEKPSNITAATQHIIKYIFTVTPAPAQARKMIYLKCLAGDLPGITDRKEG